MLTNDPSAYDPAATAPAPPPPPPDINIPGYSADDYNTFIQSDPGYLALKAAQKANEDSYSASMRGAVQKAVLNSGYAIPEASGYLDAGQADQAAQNPYSQAALALQAHSNALRGIQNALAARGGYDSGELTYGVGNEGQRFNVEDLGNRGKLADYINGLVSQGAQMQSGDAANLAAELGNALNRQFALHPGTQSTTAHWDGSVGAYVDANGNRYDVNGAPVTSPVAPPTPPPDPGTYSTSGTTYTPPPWTPMPVTPPTSYNYGGGVGQTPLSKLLNIPV